MLQNLIKWLLVFGSVTVLGLHAEPSHLHQAVASGDVQRVNELLQQGVSPEERDDQGQTPLFLAVQSEGREMVMLLLRHHADVGARDAQGCTPFLIAAAHDQTVAALLLLDQGAKLGATDKDGNSALHYAASTGSLRMVEFLLARGLDLEKTNRHHRTPLMAAILGSPLFETSEVGERVQAAELLLTRGANPNAQDLEGNMPLHLSASADALSPFTRLLLRHGGDASARNKAGQTPADIISKRRQASIVNR
ncbi:hypothetical protein SAMN05421823_111147 [Catalinimonas alkaloidigena]|uniref:Uncharacterized protein n=1 Tax=Catalinimonas alkaloidigena TaxID=1075417 RepID=A0A1G9RG72_9BACT|nr:ankyrin repeat domain-containing protein [Catalinimonas alkaloidigena]SDM22238.1 hypothetical protein SAMN05421823_111147 [Catalinimonas alkaloidigena]